MKAEPTNTFQISFDTNEMPGKIVAVQVTLTRQIFEARGKDNLKKHFRIDLANHPLYSALCEYVRMNPPRQQK